MNMKEFYDARIASSRALDLDVGNPLRIHQDGHRYYRDTYIALCVRHRADRDFILPYTVETDGTWGARARGVDVLDALAYLRRRMAYTRIALAAADELDLQLNEWRETGIAPRLRNMRNETIRQAFIGHRAVYIELEDFLGRDLLREFLAVVPEERANREHE